MLLGDCTENWIASPENFDISNATFSSYKNHDTGKTGIWITLYGSLVMCTDTYAGSISDNDLTADCGVLDMIQDEGATVLTDKGFGIEDLCHAKGLSHNRPPMKFEAQYEETDSKKLWCGHPTDLQWKLHWTHAGLVNFECLLAQEQDWHSRMCIEKCLLIS